MTDLSAISALEARVDRLESQNRELRRKNDRLAEQIVSLRMAPTLAPPALDDLPSPREALASSDWDLDSVAQSGAPEGP